MLYSYAPSSIKCSVFGVELVGLSKDEIVTIERIGETVSMRKASDGSHTAFVDNNAAYKVTISIEQVSESNEFLHTIYKLHQRVSGNLLIPFSVTEKVTTGGTTFLSTDTFFESEPTATYLSESSERRWVFICNNASYNLRGTSESGFITDALKATIRLIELSELAGFDMSFIQDKIGIGVNKAQEKLKGMF